MRLELIPTCNRSKNLPPVNRLSPCEVTMLQKRNAWFAAKRLRTVSGFAGFHAGNANRAVLPIVRLALFRYFASDHEWL